MLALWVLAGCCLVAGFGLRLNLCWQRVRRPAREAVVPSEQRVPLDAVPAAVALTLEPYDLGGEGFTCLGVFGFSELDYDGLGCQIWLDRSGTLIGQVGFDARGSSVTCSFSFESYLGQAEDLYGIWVASRAHVLLPRYTWSSGRVVGCPGRSQLELLALHRRQRAAQPVQAFARLESMADFDRLQDEVHGLGSRWLVDNGVVVRGADGQLWAKRRVSLLAALVTMPPKRARQWAARRRMDRQIRAWPPLAD